MLFVEDLAFAYELTRRGHKVVMLSSASLPVELTAAEIIRQWDPGLIWIRLPRIPGVARRRQKVQDWRFRVAVRLAAVARRRRLHWVLEHPAHSSVWCSREIAQLCTRANSVDIDMCAFG